MKALKKYWHWILVGGIFFCEALLLLLLKDDIYVGICDNLDLFITQLKMLHDQGAFFAHGVDMPILQGIDRDYFPTELSIYNILYLVFPDIYAYILGYLLKVVVGFFASVALAKMLMGEYYEKYEKLVVLVAFAFSILPLYPTYALCFSSLPLLLLLLVKSYQRPNIGCFIGLFLYPLVSYFSFFGAFILGYLLIAICVLWIRDKKFPKVILFDFILLAIGYVVFEYRLFGLMLFSDEETIRSTMVITSLNFSGIWHSFTDALLHGVAHANSAHTFIVLPVCTVYFVYCNFKYIRHKQGGQILKDPFNLTILFILFNSIVYALYYWEPLRTLVETILPPLKGFSYGRTIFFNPFAWYFAFFIVLKKVYEKNRWIPCVLAVLSILVVGGTQGVYSDVYNTLYCNAYKFVKHTQVNQLSYQEFFAESLLDEIKEDIAYEPEQLTCAYAMHPAVLSYNGISTIDGYCGYYTQAYKEKFREVIAPTLEERDNWQQYYDNYGYRAYLYSESGDNTYDFGANTESVPQKIHIDEKVLKDMGCEYIFSRVEITNATEQGLGFIKVYGQENIPYQIYLYRVQ